MFKNIFTALITPFKESKIDYNSLGKLLELQLNSNIEGVVIAGSTGEGNSLTKDEYVELISKASKIINGKTKLIATISSTSTNQAVEIIKSISNIEIDGLMCTNPHYILPTQLGLIEHYKQICKVTKLPIIIYNHPGRTGFNIHDETLIALSHMSNIHSIKDASVDFVRPLRLKKKLKNNFTFLGADDVNLLANKANGTAGSISVISNIYPNYFNQIHNHWLDNNFAKAQENLSNLMALISLINMQPNPIGIKAAASIMNLCSNELRLPLIKSVDDIYAEIREAIFKFGKDNSDE